LQSNKTLFIDLCKQPQTVAASLQSVGGYDFVVVESAGFNQELLNRITLLRQQVKSPVILLSEYTQTPFAQKLKDMQLIDGFFVLPLSVSERHRLLDNPANSPYSNHCSPQRRIRELEKIAYTDELTGIWNRRLIDIFIKRIHKNSCGVDVLMSLLLLDIDNLKEYNDKYGHKAGDELICATAAGLKRCFRSYDVCGRIGGDEFAALLWQLPAELAAFEAQPGKRNKAPYPDKAEKIMTRLQKNTRKNKTGSKTTLSGAIISFKNDIEKFDDIFEQADLRLYEAKRKGKNIILS
jgi:diguanylate cyclase (GGDEF)-like protein